MQAFPGRAEDRSPAVRVCDADRDRVIAELRERFADGFLSHQSFEFRIDAVLRARWRDDLAGILADLPAPRPSLARAALGRLARVPRAARRRVAGYLQPPRPPPLMLPSGTKSSFTIGRDAGCDLVLSDMTVSRNHADLRREASGWMLSDAGSMNGTRLNGWRVTDPVPVRAGDEVMFGALTLVVAEHARQPSTASTP
jgi:Inner membrane component of T3SS, cytoplasmic domain/Domain of unknown function (DUF1707)